MFDNFSYYLNLGTAEFLILFLVIFAVYFSWKLVALLGEKFYWKRVEAGKRLKSFLLSALLLFGFIGLSSLIAGAGVIFVDMNSADDKITRTNDSFMALDKNIFGVYPALWLQAENNPLKPYLDFTSPIFINVYFSLTLALGIIFLILISVNARKFYEMLIAFAFCVFLSLPFWYFFPALAPFDAYVDNILGAPVPDEIRAELENFRPTAGLNEVLAELRKDRPLKESGFRAITSMPSMHVAWAALVLYFSFFASRYLLLITAPYFLLNSAATVYILQHYAVDALAGIIIATIAILFSLFIVKHFPKAKTGVITEFIQEDIKKLFGNLSRLFFKSNASTKLSE